MEPALTSPGPPAPPAGGRYLLLLALGCLALGAAWAALVLNSASWAQARALDALYPFDDAHIRPFGAGAWRGYQRASAGLAAALAGAWLLLGPLSGAGRRALAGLGAEAGALGRALAARWRALAAGQRRLWWLQLAALTAVRVALSLRLHWADDAVSFEFFVRQPSLLASAAYYPLPNNHVLSNVLDWGFYQLHPGFWWSMRLPVLLAATAGTVLLAAGLWRRLGYWPALLAAALTSWAELPLYHAAVGRGYWLLTLAATATFLATLRLAEAGSPAVEGAGTAAEPPATSPRLAWLALAVAGLVGSYAVPVFAYVLASAWGWLGWRAGRNGGRAGWGQLAGLAGVGVGVAGGTGLLYAPLLLVSGPAALTANSYVQRLDPAVFWAGLPRFAWLMEGQLVGQRYLGGVGVLVVLALFGRLWQRVRAGREPAALAAAVRQVGLPALWFGVAPYLVLLGQRVLPPERTWLYKSWFVFVLAALVLAGWRWPRRGARRGLLGVGLGLYLAYQVGNLLRLDQQARAAFPDRRAARAWLAAHPAAQPALVPSPPLWAWLSFSAHCEYPGQPLAVAQAPQPGRRYRCVVTEGAELPPPGSGPEWVRFGGLRVWRAAR